MSELLENVPLDDADYASLKAYAEVQLGIEVKRGMNSGAIRAKIKTVDPDVTHIPGFAESEPAPSAPAAPTKAKAAGPVPYDLHNPNLDPKVKLRIQKTAELFRAREVTVNVNDKVWRMKRGEIVEVPYRVYIALNNAIESRAVDTGEPNKFGMPQYDYQQVHSYPFDVLEEPDPAEVERWHRETGGSEMRVA